MWQLCIEGQVCTQAGYNALLPIRNKLPLCCFPYIILLYNVPLWIPGGRLTTWQSWRQSPLLFKIRQASCWILTFLHSFHSWFTVTSSHWSLFMPQNVFTTPVVAPLARPPSIILSCAWRVSFSSNVRQVEGSVWNSWKLTALVLTNTRGVNNRKWRLPRRNSPYLKDGHFSQCSSIRGFLMLLCAHTWLTTEPTFKRSQVQVQQSPPNTKRIATGYWLEYQLTT